jgi:hypothetical protein
VPILGLFQDVYSLSGVQHGASHPGKPDVDTQPGTKVEADGPRLYNGMHDMAIYQRDIASPQYHTIQELSTVLYSTTTAAEGCSLQFNKAASLFARQLVANSTFITQAVPILLLPDNDDFQDIPFPSLSLTFENGTATILPLAINLAAVPIRTQKEYVRPAIFWSQSIMRILEQHNWMMVHISDVYQCQSTEPYVFEHLHYLTAFINTSAHISLSHASSTQAAWPAATWQRYSRFDALAHAVYTSSRRAYIKGDDIQPFQMVELSQIVFEQDLCNAAYNTTISLSIPSGDDSTSLGMDSPIDDIESCAAMYRCHLPVSKPSRFYQIHLQLALPLLQIGRPPALLAALVNPIPPLTDVDWRMPINTVQADLLEKLTSDTMRDHCLLIDTEFVTLKGKAPSLFEVCVQAF